MPAPDKNASDHPLPGSVSDQNAEEAEPGHDDQPARSQPPPGRRGEDATGSGGESGEGSQSTGNPASAG